MSITNALASLPVKDLTSALHWYERLFGRSADSTQTELAEWQLEAGGGLQVYQSAERRAGNELQEVRLGRRAANDR